MLAYTLKRLGGILITLLLLSFFTFMLSRVVPGGPWMQGAEIPMSDQQVAAFKEKYGLDEPAWKQYLLWLRKLAALAGLSPYLRRREEIVDPINNLLSLLAICTSPGRQSAFQPIAVT